MATAIADFTCSNQECRAAETGKCVEGLSLDNCPHLVRIGHVAPDREQIIQSSASQDTEKKADLQLPRAERLNISQASAILKSKPSRVVAIVGPTASGKTSLIASLCNLFQKGPVDNIHFARSRTFFAFEQACHHARAVSRRSVPQTEHTHLASGVGFYHLGVVEDREFRQLLLADRPGEDYRAVADDPANAALFPEISRSDSMLVMVNGEQLLDIGARHNVRQDTIMILQGLKDGDGLTGTQRLAVVLTKLDVIETADPEIRDRALRDFDSLLNMIRASFAESFEEILPFRIAASPATTILPYAFGTDELLKFWLEPESVPRVQPSLERPSRAMGRYGAEMERTAL